MAVVKRMKVGGKPSYLVRIASTDDLTGRRRNINVGTFKTLKLAEAAERSAIVQRDHGTLLDPDKTTVAELLEDWLKAKADEVSAQSLVDYRSTIKTHVVPALGTVRVQALTAQKIDAQYRAWRDGGMSIRVVRGCHLRLSQALDRATTFNMIPANPCRSVQPPRLEVKRSDVWSAEQIGVFLRHAETDGLHPLWHLLAIEGLRRGEALGVRWKDIDLDTGVIRIVQQVQSDKNAGGSPRIIPRTKTGAGTRSVSLTSDTLTALKAHRTAWLARKLAATEWGDGDLIICTRTGGPIHPNRLTRHFDRMIAAIAATEAVKGDKAITLPRIRIHDLRHSAATMMIQAGVPVNVASQRLGHARTSVTMDIYAHVMPGQQADAAAVLSRVLAAASGGPS